MANEMIQVDPDELRERARQLYTAASRSFFELGQVFYEIRETEAYQEWGYSSYVEYAEKEFGIKTRTAQTWIQTWEKFSRNLGYTWDDVEKVGWSKLSKIGTVVESRKDANTWLKKAQKMSRPALEQALKDEKERRREASGEPPQQPTKVTRIDHDIESEIAGTAASTDVPFAGAASYVDEVDDEPEGVDGEPVPMHKFQVYLFEKQWIHLQAALEIAAKLANSDKVSHLVDMMANEFITTYENTGQTAAHGLARIVKMLESTYDVTIDVTVKEGSWLTDAARTVNAETGPPEKPAQPSQPAKGAKRRGPPPNYKW